MNQALGWLSEAGCAAGDQSMVWAAVNPRHPVASGSTPEIQCVGHEKHIDAASIHGWPPPISQARIGRKATYMDVHVMGV